MGLICDGILVVIGLKTVVHRCWSDLYVIDVDVNGNEWQ